MKSSIVRVLSYFAIAQVLPFTASAETDTGDDVPEGMLVQTSSEPRRATVEARAAYQNRLLELATSEPRNTTLRDSLTTSLIESAKSEIARFDDFAENYHRAEIAALRRDRQVQSIDFVNRLKDNRELTIPVRKRVEATEMNEMILQLQKQSAEIHAERKQLRTQNKLSAARRKQILPLNAATGSRQNTILEALNREHLVYGYSISDASHLGSEISKLTLSDDDISKIRLKTITEAGEITFALLEGSSQRDPLPFLLRLSSLRAMISSIEAQMEEIAAMDSTQDQFVTSTIELHSKVEKLEKDFYEEFGDPQYAAKKGKVYYRQWTMARDFITGLQATTYCLEIENGNRILQSRFQYDPRKYGNGILPLVTFVSTNSCQFAPAKPGDEAAYVRLQRRLMELYTLLEDDSHADNP